MALTPLHELRPGLEPTVVRAIEAGMALRFGERPQTAAALRHIFSEPASPITDLDLTAYDLELVRLRQFRFERRQCPSCGEPIEDPKPLPRGACPVCHQGYIKPRSLSELQCPVCKMGALHRQSNVSPLTACPNCKTGRLGSRRKSLLKATLVLTCQSCHAVYESTNRGMTPIADPMAEQTWDEWRTVSGRSEEIWRCDSCGAQLDSAPDGRRKIVTKAKDVEFECLYPEEWARVAAGLQPGSGNAVCNACEADYYLGESGDSRAKNLTLLDAHDDPFEFAEHHLGRLLNQEDARWLAVGKESANPGLYCRHCETEFDREGDSYRLVRSHNPALARFDHEPFSFEDWHRLAAGLPTLSNEAAFVDGIEQAIARAYVAGELGLDSENRLLWKGPAICVADDQEAALTITRDEIVFGGLLRKTRQPMDALTSVEGHDDRLTLIFRGTIEPVEYDLSGIELSVELTSGIRTARICAEHLAARLSNSA